VSRKENKKTKKMMERNQQTPSQLYSGALRSQSSGVIKTRHGSIFQFQIKNCSSPHKNKEKFLVCLFFSGGIYFFSISNKK
jgi:hypothetical protein